MATIERAVLFPQPPGQLDVAPLCTTMRVLAHECVAHDEANGESSLWVLCYLAERLGLADLAVELWALKGAGRRHGDE